MIFVGNEFAGSANSVTIWNLCSKLKVKAAHLCPTLCDPVDYTVLGILQARILEWVAFPFSRESSQPRDQTQVSYIASGLLPYELPGKPKNTEVSSLFLPQQIFSVPGMSCIVGRYFTN